ncbi:MAG: DEAD/DEAH box helicase [Treponemataceae bacterium]|nr:DEAD/DEAH box helicase [Treponemataceae bacterium]
MPQQNRFENPLIVQSDRTLLLDVHAPRADECRNALIPFAELERSPEHLHTYRLTPLSLWNAAGAGFFPEDAVAVLHEFARYDVPQSVEQWIRETAGRFGKLRLIPAPSVAVPCHPSAIVAPDAEDTKPAEIEEAYLYLVTESRAVFKEIAASVLVKKQMLTIVPYVAPQKDAAAVSDDEKQQCFLLALTDRGTIKQELLKMGWPVKDDVPMSDGEPLALSLRKTARSGKPFAVRKYQALAAQALVGNKGAGTGFGTIVLPCGAGKTIVGMQVMALLQTSTLIVTTNVTAVHQWIDELLDKTDLTADQIAEYTGARKTIRPVTVATYQILTWRPEKDGPYPHFSLFRERDWGLIIYDEVHMLPAPVFRVVAEIQAVRRVGLTATLVREDGLQGNVFSLVGPKRYDVPWKDLEADGWIASAECVEIRLDLDGAAEIEYAVAEPRKKHRIASENPAKLAVVQELVRRFPDDKVLIIGQYLDQLNEIARLLSAPIITGKTPNDERDARYAQFRAGEIRVLVVSKVANFAIDLPDASMAIQVSGTFGSRQEEAQRLGRILRPKERTSRFFTLITRNTVEEDFGSNRQKFLAEQGYAYRLIRYKTADDLDAVAGECVARIEA